MAAKCFSFFVTIDRKSTRLNSSHLVISYAVFCLKKIHSRGQPPGQAGGASRGWGEGGLARVTPPLNPHTYSTRRHLLPWHLPRCDFFFFFSAGAPPLLPPPPLPHPSRY